MQEKIKVIFFGSSYFSIDSFEEIANSRNIELSAVVTAEARQKNRGMQLSNNIVYDHAIKYLPKEKIFTPKTLKNDELYEILKNFNADIYVLVAYGKIIPQKIIDLPKIDFINLHPSSLPKWRGAAPIERTIENGELDLDICIIRLINKLDAGDILNKINYKFKINDHADKIISEVSKIGSKLLLESIIKLQKGEEILYTKQKEDSNIKYADKINKNELLIKFNDDVVKNFNKIKAFNNSGCCYFIDQDNKRIKIIEAKSYSLKKNDDINNNIGFDEKKGILNFQNGAIEIKILQKEGGKIISIENFINGIKNK